MCPLFFDQMPGSCSYFTYKVGFENSIFRLRARLCSYMVVTQPRLRPRGPFRVSPSNCFLHFFFFLTFHCTISYWILKHVTINVINNHIYLIITLLSLDPLPCILWEMTFSQNWILHSCLSRAISPLFRLDFCWFLSML